MTPKHYSMTDDILGGSAPNDQSFSATDILCPMCGLPKEFKDYGTWYPSCKCNIPGSAPVDEMKFDSSFKFGDIVENYWAGERNPHRKGIVVRVESKSLYCTDGKGRFWNLVKDKESKTKVIGSILSLQGTEGGMRDFDSKQFYEYMRKNDFAWSKDAETEQAWCDAVKLYFTLLKDESSNEQGAAQEQPVGAEGWISVEDKLPEVKEGEDNSENVFVILEGRIRIMAYCYIDEGYDDEGGENLSGWAWCDCGMQIDGDPEFDDDYKPTHWQSIPKLPNSPQNKGGDK